MVKIDRNDDTPLLVTRTGKRYSSKYMSNYVKRIIANSGCDWLKFKEGNVSPHWMRHLYAEYSQIQGASTRDIMKAVGHKQQATTEIYLEDRSKKKQEAALKWDDDYFE
ncbi:hypothetical protein CR203_23425 [Salipaludibacillus neizhouensis]|uniref:Tyr recombinase domain-containing protein n=1 Tax=Salipaludibacillus neizhouensis TaxID=885475 RepID=A0A3A9K3B4_9BACI|nr:site-specific integrase [Salipaludibacillus neizhouensis]RKL64962.1 hypothetical protein CR203_23425 [Salipaludibacillus neizhouensis]